MRYMQLICVLWMCLAWNSNLLAESGKILKVLPHYIDKKGQHSLSPSLYERDAYQAQLRKNPAQRTGMRFDIHWKASKAKTKQLKLKLELRTSNTGFAKSRHFEQTVSRGLFGYRWSGIPILGDDFQELGEILAWRVTLWDKDRQIAEQRSFLW